MCLTGADLILAVCFCRWVLHVPRFLLFFRILPAPTLQKTTPSDCQSGPAAIIYSSAAPASSLSIPHSSLRATSVRGVSADEAWEKLAVRHIPLLPSLCLHLSWSLPYSVCSLSLPFPFTLFSPVLLSFFLPQPLCLVAPLIHYISTPLLHPPTPTPPSFFLVHNM